jgi:hypothetical protein
LGKQYQPLGTCLLQETDQERAQAAVQAEKCMTKKAEREQVLASMKVLTFANTGRGTVADLDKKTKQSAVTTMIKPIQKKRKTAIDKNNEETDPVRKVKKKALSARKPKGNKEAKLPMGAA